jgi:hypothetical protein
VPARDELAALRAERPPAVPRGGEEWSCCAGELVSPTAQLPQPPYKIISRSSTLKPDGANRS